MSLRTGTSCLHLMGTPSYVLLVTALQCLTYFSIPATHYHLRIAKTSRIVVSNNGRFLISVDVEGHALFINLSRRVVLDRINFKRKVYDIKFSPNDEMFAVTFGHGCQIWRSPGKYVVLNLLLPFYSMNCTAYRQIA
jgi:hypothetical protein